jgi:predicted transposase YdaD
MSEFAESYGPSTTADDWRASVLNFRVFVDDLTAETDERLRARAMTDVGKLALLTLRHARDEDLMDRLEQWADLWAAVSRARSGLMALAAIVSYIGKVSASPSPERLMRLIPADAEEARVMVPTLFERLQEEGRQKGWQEGRQEGLLTGLREAISKLLHQRFGELPPAIVQRIEQADPATLDRWMERVLTAPTLADVLA